MSSFANYLKSLAAGYRRLFSGLGGVLLAALILALLSALVALPLWYLAIRTPRLFSWLAAVAVAGWIGFRRIPALLRSRERRREEGGAPRRPFRRTLLTLQIVLLALVLYIAAASLVRGLIPPGLLFLLVGALLLGNLLRAAE